MNKTILTTLVSVLLGNTLAVPVTSLTGPIKDWKAGDTGEVQLYVGNLAPNNLDFLLFTAALIEYAPPCP